MESKITMERFEAVTDTNWEEFTSHPMAVLLVGETDCPACKAWTEELCAGLETDESWKHVRFGNADDTAGFRKSNQEWLDMIQGVPFNVIYVDGQPQTSFYGGGIERLWKRLERFSKSDE